MKKDVFLHKVGFSLKIDDLPECYEKKDNVIQWESQFYKNEVMKGVFKASIDTTFALHRPWTKVGCMTGLTKHYRVDYPYQARHLPWYEDSKHLSDESMYYYIHVKPNINNW
jgi:hypothetical protein